jgi:hypothetical protein
MGLRAAHAWRVSPSADGATVRTDESLSGLPARLFAGRLRRRLQADLDAWVRLLKLEAESRAKEEEEDDAAAPLTDVPGEDRAQTEAGEGDASPPGPSSGEPSA